MKRNKISSRKSPVKGNQKLTFFFKKLSETNENKLKETPNETTSNSTANNASKKRKNLWEIDTISPDKENCESCVKIPNKRKANAATFQNASTSKHSPVKIHNTSGNKSATKLVKTPPKLKFHKSPVKSTSPSKLYTKSPKKLHQFNVEVINNFLSLSPRIPNTVNSNITSNLLEQGTENLQGTSKRNILEVQQQNEQTPTKTETEFRFPPINSAAKVKLDFNDKNQTVDKSLFEDESNNLSELGHLLEDEWDESFNTKETQSYSLCLKDQHCKVLTVNQQNQVTTLIVQSLETTQKAILVLNEFWSTMRIVSGVSLYVNATFDALKSVWFVNNNRGLIVYEPSHLVSTTSVVGALFCKRRAFFSEIFKGLEPPNKFMVLGTFIHELLQEALKNDYSTLEKLKKLAETKINTKDMIYQFYSSSINPNDINAEVMEYCERIHNFVQKYVKKSSQKSLFNAKDNWKGQIENVKDIEENIWCPQLGLKGKIDVTVQSGLKTIPLELKTGRASVSLEHRGQIMLYLMMMSKVGYTVSSGLLLYLKEEILREIPLTNNEKRDLIILRNELTYYLTNKNKIRNLEKEKLLEIPEPINHHSACGKCPYNVPCSVYLKYENKNLDDNKHLKKVQNLVLSHLKQIHIEYFINWVHLLELEEEHFKGKKLKEIYTVPPAEREKNGCCVINLKITKINVDSNKLYGTTFAKHIKEEENNFYSSGIGEGNYVIVSTDSRVAIASGFVSHIDYNEIIISIDRDLTKLYPNKIFHLDTYDFSVGQAFNKTCLALILEDNERMKKLRDIIIEKKSPIYHTKLSKKVIVKGAHILKALNKVQQRAVLKALAAEDYLLIQGMPGSGKTATIVALIQLLNDLNKTVLITSHTHSAVDNVCIKLIEKGVKLMRLGSERRIHPKVLHFSENSLTKDCNTVEQLEHVYNETKIVAVTCLGSSHPLLSKRIFDYCIIDESTQLIQTSAFRVLSACKKFVLVGDPEQLPPVVQSKEAIKKGLSESLFKCLQQPEALAKLTSNYRMNKRLTEIANILTYNGELEVANEDVANATLTLDSLQKLMSVYEGSEWLLKILNNSLATSFQIVDTGNIWELKQDPLWYSNLKLTTVFKNNEIVRHVNSCEISLVIYIVKALLMAGVKESDLGVMSPYRVQIDIIKDILNKYQDIEVKTVDQFQGRDKQVIIYSCSKSCDPNSVVQIDKYEILEDKRRLNVAITRAKRKFILIGDVNYVKNYTPFKTLLNNLPENNFLRLKNKELGFCWDTIMKTVNNI